MYYATYSNEHPEEGILSLLSLGDWSEEGQPRDRVAFFCRTRPGADSYEVGLEDAASSPWSDVELVGKMLTREEALRHPAKDEMFAALDAVFACDPSVRGFFDRLACGDAAEPLEKRFGLPDEVFALGAAAKDRAFIGACFVELDKSRFFVRSLLPITVEHYGTWSLGVWIEVPEADRVRVVKGWDGDGYTGLTFEGKLANDLTEDLEAPIGLGVEVYVEVVEPKALPSVKTSKDEALAALLARVWPRSEFERFALPRGFI